MKLFAHHSPFSVETAIATGRYQGLPQLGPCSQLGSKDWQASSQEPRQKQNGRNEKGK